MSAPAPTKPPAQKPSGPVTYLESKGADVWPSWRRRDRADVRVLDGEFVYVREFREDGTVAVSVGGQERVMTRSEWRSLPLYDG